MRGWRCLLSTAPEPESLPPRILRLRIRGFRSYGTEAREMELDNPITVIKADNSQGKTSTAEALEFLLTGSSSRRDLFGGAKAEYEGTLANVHLPPSDRAVWVEADIRCPDGVERTVRRELKADYARGSDCGSDVTIDGKSVGELDVLGIPFGEPPLAAPILLQHNIRYVLSTEPQKRADYFRALLELRDLDIVKGAIERAQRRIKGLPPLHWATALETLRRSLPANGPAAQALAKAARAPDQATVTTCLLEAAASLYSPTNRKGVEEVITILHAMKARAEEEVFPIGALTPRLDAMPARINPTDIQSHLTSYVQQLRDIDSEVAKMAPIFEAVLHNSHLDRLPQSQPCPVCADGTLGPRRIGEIREHLSAAEHVQRSVAAVKADLRSVVPSVDQAGRGLKAVLPGASSWDDRRWAEVSAHYQRLAESQVEHQLDADESARGQMTRAAGAVERLREIRRQIRDVVEATSALVDDRVEAKDQLTPLLDQVNECISEVQTGATNLKALVDRLHEDLGDKLLAAKMSLGTREILDLLEHRDELFRDLRVDMQRRSAKKRMDEAGRQVDAAVLALLDLRFDDIGVEIERWWNTLRPDEPVAFGAVGRRASGRRYVKLTAHLSSSEGRAPAERAAIGVFSDSQLNALALSTFLARQQLLGSPVIIFDDPLPGYDPEHRLAFTLRTLGKLLDDGTQVIVSTHDPKLAVDIVEVHRHRDLGHYELALVDMVEGTMVTNEGDLFGRYLLEAQDAIASLTVEGRRNAANALRRAAERLAKQIIATGRTQAGTPTRVSDIGEKTLSQLIADVLGFARGNDERGRWNLWRTSLNPGAHDNDVPLQAELKTVLGDIKKLNKDHQAHWPGGLLK